MWQCTVSPPKHYFSAKTLVESGRYRYWDWTLGNVRHGKALLPSASNHSCSDFADAYPNCEVTGTDISPIQPTWVPPNLKL